MDDELKNLEAELQRLRPRAPSPALMARIERDLSAAPALKPGKAGAAPRIAEVRRFDWRWAALALPAAAALAVGLFVAIRPAPERERGAVSTVPAAGEHSTLEQASAASASAADDLLKPIAAENLLLTARDEGLVTLDDGTPARRERLQYVDTITWKNPRTNASLTWSVPREEVRIVPVRFQ